jgi:GLPGLI family protein
MFAVVPRIASGNSSLLLIDQYKKTQPQFLRMQSVLSFNQDHSLYEPIKSLSTVSYNNDPSVTQNNIVFTDFNSKKSIVQKDVIGETFLVNDQLRKIKWKLTTETREIAGFMCRRANGVILDSIYVVAFFTHDIPIPGGPESFSGLPGMILQVTLPHENVTWLATEVKDMVTTVKSPPSKGTSVTYEGLSKALISSLQRYGPKLQYYLKALLL